MTLQAKSLENGARGSDSTVEEGGAAVAAVRQRVLRTVSVAKHRIAEANVRVRAAATAAAQATDRYVHENPWKSIAYGAAAGATVALIVTALARRD